MRQLLTILTLCLCSCSDPRAQEERDRAQKAAHQAYQAEIRLLSNLDTAVPELESRVRKWLDVEGDLIVMKAQPETPESGWVVMPKSVPWMITCDSTTIQMSIGHSVEVEQEGTSYGVSKTLAFVPVKDFDCKKLALSLGHRIADMLR
jgi:hypothetical protein